ncbi:MAG: tetratricopeptide repeat protein [Phycisphaerales bacterium]|nr:MAG: tetratricopeptide repeat protein [Phycisphaerales bacterium]
MPRSLRATTFALWIGACLLAGWAGVGVAPRGAIATDETSPPAENAEVARPEVILILKGGQRITGTLISQDDTTIVLRVGAVDVRVPREDVEHLNVQRPARERYRELRSLIDDADSERLLQLAEWLRERGLYDEAMEEIAHVLSIEPDNPEALRLRLLINRLIALRERTANDDAREPRERAVPRRAPVETDFPLLSEEQINLIKVYELDLSNPPRIIIPRATVERFLERYSEHPLVPTTREGRTAFHRKPAAEILDVMFRVRARDLYADIRVIGNPASIDRFRDAVSRGWLATACASTACHGGDAAGSFRLYARRPHSDEGVYTNFLIIDRHRMSGDVPLINYEQPALSPLLQMGLPRDDSAYPHPNVRGWRPAFRNAQDRRFRQTVDWIESLYKPRPEHPIDYTPPGPSVRPAEGPVER